MAVDCTKCKCWIRPFEPPDGCYDCCTGKILRYAKPYELEEFFNFSLDLAEKLFEIASDDRLNRLSDFRTHLSSQEFGVTDSNFRNIQSNGWRWIETTLKERIKREEFASAY